MRIISGILKGTNIPIPKNLSIRPTTDRAKESLFNILNNKVDFEQIRVLDLFAGTGNISFEFASRGVNSIICIDQNKRCVDFINATAKKNNIAISAIKKNVFSYLQKEIHFEFVFADPPYQWELNSYEKLHSLIFKNNKEESFSLAIEHSKKTNLSHLSFFDQCRNYGGVKFSFFSKRLTD